jgi:hypothetical protein
LGLATFLEWTGANALEEGVTVRILPDADGTAVVRLGEWVAMTNSGADA